MVAGEDPGSGHDGPAVAASNASGGRDDTDRAHLGASVGLVTIHYRDPGAIWALVDSLGRWTVRPDRVVVVDNSGDLGDTSGSPAGVSVVPAVHNPGYGAAVNLGVAALSASSSAPEWILVLTQDGRLADDALEQLLLAAAVDAQADVLAPALMFQSDPDSVFSLGGTLSRRGVALHPGQGDRRNDVRLSSVPRSVDWADGAALLVRAAALERLGGFPEEYFLYVEEVDFAWRVRRSGRRVLVVDRATGFQQPGDYRPFLHFRNSTYFTRKYREDFQAWPWVYFLAQGVKRSAARRQVYPVVQAMRGLLHGLQGRMGKPTPREARATQ